DLAPIRVRTDLHRIVVAAHEGRGVRFIDPSPAPEGAGSADPADGVFPHRDARPVVGASDLSLVEGLLPRRGPLPLPRAPTPQRSIRPNATGPEAPAPFLRKGPRRAAERRRNASHGTGLASPSVEWRRGRVVDGLRRIDVRVRRTAGIDDRSGIGDDR